MPTAFQAVLWPLCSTKIPPLPVSAFGFLLLFVAVGVILSTCLFVHLMSVHPSEVPGGQRPLYPRHQPVVKAW